MESKKRPRKGISLETKIAILDCLARGEGPTAIGKRFSLGESTVRAIKKNEDAIRKSVVNGTKIKCQANTIFQRCFIRTNGTSAHNLD
ncbi:CENP-B N-terminal DNA-binding domain [Popillia japonica]|uniref:CENP-B N-terminal DNA-binding domain n=1 Tax=Popillia japonica TaxID=7064 RepID=A0AAW1MEB5_POPJA